MEIQFKKAPSTRVYLQRMSPSCTSAKKVRCRFVNQSDQRDLYYVYYAEDNVFGPRTN